MLYVLNWLTVKEMAGLEEESVARADQFHLSLWVRGIELLITPSCKAVPKPRNVARQH